MLSRPAFSPKNPFSAFIHVNCLTTFESLVVFLYFDTALFKGIAMFGIRFLGGSMSAGALRNTHEIIAHFSYGSQCMAPLIGAIKLCRTMFSADATGDLDSSKALCG